MNNRVDEYISNALKSGEYREMAYMQKGTRIVIADGHYRGIRFIVENLGIHPCAYVQIPEHYKVVKDVEYEWDIDIHCHGGCTYLSPSLMIAEDDCILDAGKVWIGWDYAHFGDYEGYFEELKHKPDGKRWTTYEIVKECVCVIDEILDKEKTE